MKKLVILTILAMFLLSSCIASPKDNNSTLPVNSTPTPTLKATKGKSRIALVMKTLTNPFFIEMEKGARKAETEYGIELIVKTAAQETSIEQQIEIVNSLILDKVDAIVIAPGDSLELVPVLKKAQDAGIVVINIDNRLDPDLSKKMGLLLVPYISVDNEQGAFLSAKYISDQLKTGGQALILEGIRGAKNAEDRKNGALRAFQENHSISEILMDTANWKIDEAYEVTKTYISKNPGIKLIFCANDMMAFGAIQYLDEINRKDVLVAGFDALKQAKDAISEKKLAVTIDQQAATQGYLGIQYAIKSLTHQTPPPVTLIDVKVVDLGNLLQP